MTKIDILTLFPEFFEQFKTTSIIKRAIDKGLVDIHIYNFRDYSDDRLKRVDEAPIGGGAGMIIRLQPVLDCLKQIRKENTHVYLMSAKGPLFKQELAKKMAVEQEHIVLICGHYEGIDDRILNYIDGEICIGDYILTGGEIPAMIVADSIIRLIDGAIKKESSEDESFENNLLEYPQYASPRDYEGHKVPDILYTGNHKEISKWREKQSLLTTMKNRPDMLKEENLTKKQQKALAYDETDAVLKAKKFMK